MRYIKLLLMVAVCAMIVGCGGGSGSDKTQYSYDYKAITEAGYYQDVIMQPNGEFLARVKLDDASADSSGGVYKVEVNENGKISKITAMFGGNPINTEWSDTLSRGFEFSAVTMEYQNGYVKYNFKNARMAAAPGFYGAYSIRYKVGTEGESCKIAYLYNKDGEQADTGQGYAQMFFSYDDKGNLSEVGYANTNGERVTTVNNEYETRFKYEKNKKPVEIANYGKDGSLLADKTGIAKQVYKFDSLGRTSEVKHYGTDDSLKEKAGENLSFDEKVITALSAGATTKYSYDENRMLPSRISFYGKDEQPLGIKAWGNIASYEFKYTPSGQIAEISSFGTDDSPMPLDKNTIGDNVVKIVFVYDDSGNMSRMSFYGKDDHMVVASLLNASEERRKYDGKRRVTEFAYFGTGEDAIDINKDGIKYHRVAIEYNDDDEVTKQTYYDKSGKEVKAPAKPSSSGALASTGSSSGQQAGKGDYYVGAYSDGTSVYLLTNTVVVQSRSPYTFTCDVRDSTGSSLHYSFYPADGSPHYRNSEGYEGTVFGGQSPVAANIYRYVVSNW